MKTTLLIFLLPLLLSLGHHLHAQTPEHPPLPHENNDQPQLSFNSENRCLYNSHLYKTSHLAIHGGLLATGIGITAVGTLHEAIDDNLNISLDNIRNGKIHIDDYIQYAPVVTAFALKAFGMESNHNYRDLICLTAASYILETLTVNGIKYTARVMRPDGRSANSFPSGHTATAFVGAHILYKEYGCRYPAIAVLGYSIATTVAFMRMYNQRHWFSDVVGGAALGVLSVSTSYWLAPKIFK